MLSRAANSIYWMGRYMERADNIARAISVNTHLMLDLGLERSHEHWHPLVVTSGDEADFARRYTEASEKNVVRFLSFDEENPNSIISCIENARENARTVREIISSEMWREINETYHMVREYSRKKKIGDLQPFCRLVTQASNLFTGLVENTITHGEAWHFTRLGRMIERADKTARILDVKYFTLLPSLDYFDSPYDTVEWGAVLKSASAFEAYRKQYHRVNYKNVIDFLMFDPYFPRSMRYTVSALWDSLQVIVTELKIKSDVENKPRELCEFLISYNVDKVLENGLHEFIDEFQLRLNAVDSEIYRAFFSH